MRKWINIITENATVSTPSVNEAIVDSLPEKPMKKTFAIIIDGVNKVNIENEQLARDFVNELRRERPDLKIELGTIEVPKDSTYEGAIVETIRKVSGGYRLVSKSGKNLGTYPSKAGAEKREKQVQYFKHVDEDVADDSDNLTEIVWLDENLHKWFKEKWVRFGPDGKIRGECARGSEGEGKPKCLPQSKAHSLGKKGRASAAARKRREDPNPDRSGPAKNVATKKKTNEGVAEGMEGQVVFSGSGADGGKYEIIQTGPTDFMIHANGKHIDTYSSLQRVMSVLKNEVPGLKKGVAEEQLDEKWSAKYKRSINCDNPRGFSQRAHCAGRKKKVNESNKKLSIQLYCPHCDGPLVEESQINEKKMLATIK